MKIRSLILFASVFVALLASAALAGADQSAAMTTDILVYDSTPGGIVAAIAAAEEGRDVILITEDRHVGGLRTNGLAMSNAGNQATFGGLGREFHERVYRYYLGKYGPDSEQVKACRKGLRFEPHVAEKVFVDWLAEAKVKVLMEEVVESVQKEGATIISVVTEKKRRISASVFIDASYEGDLVKWAGCSNRVGREGVDEYGESLAGVRVAGPKKGQADDKTQGFTFRVCLTDVEENRVPITKPANYHRATYSIDAAKLQMNPPTSLRQILPLNMLPNRKTDSRVGEWIGGSWAYPEATREARRIISQEHREYSQGYLWFLLNDESVPRVVREDLFLLLELGRHRC